MRRFAPRDRGVSPVIGVTMMVAVVVVLAALFATLALGFEDDLQKPSPQGGFSTEMYLAGEDNGGKPYFELTYETGPITDASRIVVKDGNGNAVTWEDVWTTSGDVRAGEYIHIDGSGSDGALQHVCTQGQVYYVVYQNDDGESIDTIEYEVPAEPDTSNAPADWC